MPTVPAPKPIRTKNEVALLEAIRAFLKANDDPEMHLPEKASREAVVALFNARLRMRELLYKADAEGTQS